MLPILYQDAHLVAIDKPAGLLVHRTGLDAGETRFAVQLLRDQLGQPVWPLHRLDKGTSGVLLFALDADTASAGSSYFQSALTVAKCYLAMVRGWPAEVGSIDHPLTRMADDARPSTRAATAQEAVTRFQRMATYALPLPYGPFGQTRCAMLALSPETGRRHQLRRHCKHIAHPILGDATHGKGPLNRAVASWLGIQRLWLHAHTLSLPHPWRGERLEIEAPVGPEWQPWAATRAG
jgi:tRNA pseudouridine65 synthase